MSAGMFVFIEHGNKLIIVLSLADVLKPAKHAVQGLLKILRPDLKKTLHATDIVNYLQDMTNSKLIAMTNGGEESVLSTLNHTVSVSTERLEKVVDATGAGDAFLGGMIAGLHFIGLPTTEEQLRELGELANRSGACNCLSVGALPKEESEEFLHREITKFQNRTKHKKADVSPNKQEDIISSFKNMEIATSIDVCKNVNVKETMSEFHDIKIEKNTTTSNAVKLANGTHDETKIAHKSSIFLQSIQVTIKALQVLEEKLDLSVCKSFVDAMDKCTGTIYTSGIGKSGQVANRFSSSLSSIGVRASYVHVSEWSHGDLGNLRDGDIVVFFSHSGNTAEVLYGAELVRRKNVTIFGIVGSKDSKLPPLCDNFISYGKENLHEPLNGIPTTSLVLQDTVVNGIMCDLVERRNLTRKDFLANHPGGNLGQLFAQNKK